MNKTFLRYVIPSMFAFALSGIYAIVDGFFVGNSVGDKGLAAINLAYPLTAFLQAVGSGVGMAGAIHFAICDGARQENERNRYLWIAMGMLGALSLLLLVVYFLFAPLLLQWFGAKGTLLQYSEEYMRYITLGSVFQVAGTGLIPFIRNMGSSFYAMFSMMAGFLTNILLDYILVWVYPYGVAGAAIATVIGQGVTWAIGMCFLVRRLRHLHAYWDVGWKHQAFQIAKCAPSPFGLTFVPNITLILVNHSAMQYGKELALSTYALISYITCVILLLLQGVSDGAQPLISLYHGERRPHKVHAVCRVAYRFSFMTAFVCCFLLSIFSEPIAMLFGASSQTIQNVVNTLPLFLVGLLFVSYSRVTMSYFYATQQNKLAYLLIYGEPFLLLLFLQCLPRFLSLFGTWICVPLSQIGIALWSFLLLRKVRLQEE